MAVLEDLKVKTRELLDESLRTGALTPEEHTWRRGHLTGAESLEALEALVEDLLSPPPALSSTGGNKAVSVSRSSQMTIMANRTFSVQNLGRRSEQVTIMGSTRIDLRGVGPSEALTIEMVTIMGDTTVEVPAGLKVRMDCTPIMGDCHVAPQVQSADSLIRITGVVIMGSLRVVASKK